LGSQSSERADFSHGLLFVQWLPQSLVYPYKIINKNNIYKIRY